MKFKKLTPTAQAPTQAYEEAVGYDFYSDADVVLPIFDTTSFMGVSRNIEEFLKSETAHRFTRKVKTGLAIQLPAQHVGLFRDRSGYGSGGIIVTAGVIDPDYRGELLICLLNLTPYQIVIPAGSKVAQMLVLPAATTPPQEEETLTETVRGSKGFGSSGK